MMSKLSDAENQKQRAAWQAKLKNREGLKANLDRAREELAMARKLVDKNERTFGYLDAFDKAFQVAAMAYNDLDNKIPGELVNSCRDRELRDDFEVAMSIRQAAIAEQSQSREKLKRVEQNLASTKSRIALQRGEPAILQDGAELPWDQNFIARTFTALQVSLGQIKVPTWAIRDDNSAIAFGPSVHANDAEFYSKQWFDDLKSLRMAKVAHAKTERRMSESDEGLADVKQKMIASEI